MCVCVCVCVWGGGSKVFSVVRGGVSLGFEISENGGGSLRYIKIKREKRVYQI